MKKFFLNNWVYSNYFAFSPIAATIALDETPEFSIQSLAGKSENLINPPKLLAHISHKRIGGKNLTCRALTQLRSIILAAVSMKIFAQPRQQSRGFAACQLSAYLCIVALRRFHEQRGVKIAL